MFIKNKITLETRETKLEKIKKKGLRKTLFTTVMSMGVLLGCTGMLVGCGEAGPKGDTGATGPAGPQGVAGSSFLTDEGVPTSAYGANGDVYLDTTTFNLYKKVDGVWTELGNIKGEQGEPGNPGEPGTPAVAPTVEINNDGYWIINGVPTEQKAQGEAGATPTVEINDDGYWVINGQVSQVKAEALDGTKGADGNIWTVGTEYPTTSNNGDMFLNNSTWNVYQYNGEEWVLKGNIKGQDGTSGDGSVAVEEILPSYWMSYLDTKIAEINAKSESYGYNADAFICITDQHLDGSKDYAAAVINYITERTSIKKVIFGGDTLQGGDNDKELLRDYINSFNDDLTVLGMRGNHDNWGNVDDKAYYDIVLRPLAEKIERLDDLYYCYDNDDQKIRYIITDSTYTASDGSSNLTSTEQLDWMKEKILELDSEWTTVVFHHGIYTSADISSSTINIHNDGQLIIDAIDSIYDEAQCTIAGVYSGHAHRDYLGYSTKGYPIIVQTIDTTDPSLQFDPNTQNRVDGTTTEQTFDVVFLNPTTHKFETIRVGAGSNKEIEYPEKIVQNLQSVTLDKTTATTWINGDTVTLNAILNPVNVSNRNVTWRIKSGETLGTITPNGLSCIFTPGANTGTVVIEVETEDKGFIAECTITIEEQATYIDITEQFSWTAGAIRYQTGAEEINTATTNWDFSGFVDVSSFESLRFMHIQTTATTTVYGYVFYDENKTYLSGASNYGSDYIPDEKTIIVPENAKYFRCMWMNSTHTQYQTAIQNTGIQFYCYGYLKSTEIKGVTLSKTSVSALISGEDITLKAVINPYYGLYESVTWRITSGETLGSITHDGLSCTFTPGSETGTVIIEVEVKAEEDKTFKAECTIQILEELQEIDITDRFTTWTQGCLNATDGSIDDNNAGYKVWVYSNQVDISSFSSLRFMQAQTTSTTTLYGYVFYAEDGTVIPGETNLGSDFIPDEKIVEIPENAKYFRCMWMHSTHTQYQTAIAEQNIEFYCYGK